MITTNVPSSVKFSPLRSEKSGVQQFQLDIPAGIEVKEPIVVRLENADAKAYHLSVKIGKNAKADIVEDFSSDSPASVAYHTQVHAAPDSRLRVLTLQNLSDKTDYTELRESFVDQGADVHFINCQFGGKTAKTELLQNGIGANSTLNTDFISSANSDQVVTCTDKKLGPR